MSAGSGDFWSRRKAAVAAETAQDAHATEAAPTSDARDAARDDAEILAEMGLPDPDTLQAGDDFSAFMARAVPDRLRRRALRRLWLSDPTLANLDDLVDYGEDFTDAARVVENMQTAYQVGKGMLSHIDKMAAEADAGPAAPDAGALTVAEAEAEPAAATAADAPPPDDRALAGAAPDGNEIAEGGAQPQGAAEPPASDETLAVPRRMRFTPV